MADSRSEFARRIGVGEPNRSLLRHGKATRRRPVTVEEGPNRGHVGGFHTDHHDGRVDAQVFAPTVTTTIPLPDKE